jgi:hypothetical protein
MIEVQIIATGLSRIELDGFADDEGDGFRFEFVRVTCPPGI